MLPLHLTIDEVDAEDILALRTRVLRPHFDAAKVADFDGDEADNTHHFAALDDQKVVAVVSYFAQAMPGKTPGDGNADKPGALRLRGMAVDEDLQHQGVGSHLLTTTLTRLPLLYPTAHWVWCNARQEALRFYERLDFEAFGEPFCIEDIGPHRRMRRRLPIAVA